MIVLHEDGRNCRFLKFEVRFKDLDNDRVIYTDNITPTLLLVEEFPDRFSLVSYGEFIPTAEYTKRLKKVNSLNLEHPENYLSDLDRYVMLGVMTNRATELQEIYNLAQEDTRRFLINILSTGIQNCRDEKIQAGVVYNGVSYKANDKARTNILTYLLADKADTEVVNWKDKDGIPRELTIKQLKELLKKISTLLEIAFEAEARVIKQLTELPLDTLTDFKETNMYSRSGRNVLETRNMVVSDIYNHNYDIIKSERA